MRGNSDALRSLFLTALMVVSVFATTVAVSGGATAVEDVSIEQSVEYTADDIDVTSTTLTPDGSDREYNNVYAGETIAIEVPDATDDTNVLIEETEGSIIADDIITDNSQVYVLETDDLDSGQRYNITVDDLTTAGFRVSDLDLDVAVEDADLTEEDDIIVNATARRGRQPATATLIDEDNDDVVSTVNTLRSNQRVDFNLGSHSAGDSPYTVEVTDSQTGVTVESDEITSAGPEPAMQPSRRAS